MSSAGFSFINNKIFSFSFLKTWDYLFKFLIIIYYRQFVASGTLVEWQVSILKCQPNNCNGHVIVIHFSQFSFFFIVFLSLFAYPSKWPVSSGYNRSSAVVGAHITRLTWIWTIYYSKKNFSQFQTRKLDTCVYLNICVPCTGIKTNLLSSFQSSSLNEDIWLWLTLNKPKSLWLFFAH